MDFLCCIKDFFERVRAGKIFAFVLAGVFVLFAVLGICFIKTPAVYNYHLVLCDKFVDRVCYAERSVFSICFERFLGEILLIVIVCCSGVHYAALVFPTAIVAYRAYTFGGSLYIFFGVYKLSGALIVFVLYAPVHLLVDALLICATAASFKRAGCFSFCKEDFLILGLDFLLITLILVLVCLIEGILLAAIFHPIGNLI